MNRAIRNRRQVGGYEWVMSWPPFAVWGKR